MIPVIAVLAESGFVHEGLSQNQIVGGGVLLFSAAHVRERIQLTHRKNGSL